MGLINEVLEYWLIAPWYIALVMATFVHLNIYFWGGLIGQILTNNIWPMMKLGCQIDQHPPKQGQIKTEIKHGVKACILFGFVTLSYRVQVVGLWPEDILQVFALILGFLIYYNIYGYATHRLLHTKLFRRIHMVHHSSVRVTPWSGYNVHFVEAFIMAITLPVFMLFVPVGLGMAFVFHALGMMFTTCIHCNYDLLPGLPKRHWMRMLFNDPAFHRMHHTKGNVNYGFTTGIMDRIFGTYEVNMFDDIDQKYQVSQKNN